MPINEIVQYLKSEQYKQAESAAIEALRANRSDVRCWRLLGEALREQGYGGSARRAFRRAWLLDPVRNEWEDLERRLRHIPEGEERVDIEGLLHVPRVTVSAAMIVKDAETTIERSLRSLQGAVDRIMLFDYGSTDRTMQIAETVPDVEIHRLEWKDSFGSLRNEALERLDTDWVLWLNGDEWLHEDDRDAVREAAGCFKALSRPVALHILQLSQMKENGVVREGVSRGRLFPLGQGLRFYGRVYEQVGTLQGGMYDPHLLKGMIGIRCLSAPGGTESSAEADKQHTERNRTMLLRMVKEEPNNPLWWYYLGKETLSAQGLEESVVYLRTSLQAAELQPRFTRHVDVYKLLLKAYRKLGDERGMEETYQAMVSAEPKHPDVQLLWAKRKRSLAARSLREAIRHLETAKRNSLMYRGPMAADRAILEYQADLAYADALSQLGLLAEADQFYARHEQRSEVREYVASRREWIRKQAERLEKPQNRKGIEHDK